MKKQFIVPVRVTAFTKEEAQSQIDLLIQIGAFFKDFNVQNLAGIALQHLLIAGASRLSKGDIDLSRCYCSPNVAEQYSNSYDRLKQNEKPTEKSKI